MSVGRRDGSEVKTLATESEDPSFITRTHNEKKKDDSCKMSSDLHRHTLSYACPYKYTQTHKETTITPM